MALASPSHTQPISRPSSNPHSIVRKAIDEIIQAPAACNFDSADPQPVFLGLEERRRERLEKERAAEVLEINLDEDGPLREEYLPKRRSHGTGFPRHPKHSTSHVADGVQAWNCHSMGDTSKPLPPPAKWSPAGDEPIYRERNGHYVAVQPPLMAPIAPYPPPYPPHPHDVAYPFANWHSGGAYVAIKPQPYPIEFPRMPNATQSIYNPYPYIPENAYSHSRTQSLSYDQDSQAHNHMRSYSQAQFEYRCSDLRMTANELAPHHHEVDSQWPTAGHYVYPAAPAFGPLPGINYHSAWLRT